MKIRIRTMIGAAVAVAAPVTFLFAAVPHSFSPNTVISSAQVNDNFAALDDRVTTLMAQVAALRAAPTWTNADLLNSWVDYGTGYSPPGFTKDAQGFVHTRGLVTRPTAPANVTVFVLPAGFRPQYMLEAPLACANNIPCEVIIRPNGEVYFETGDIAWVALDGLTFPAAPSP